MALPRILVTGASGFIGRHLLDALKDRYRIVSLARRSQARCGAPFHENITWHQVDIGDPFTLAEVFAEIRQGDPIDIVIHLAAHYDFTGEDHPEYNRTNVEGLRNILEHCKALQPKRFVFSSSVAACDFPAPGGALDELSPPDGDHIYAQTKAIGERMLAEYRDHFPSVIVRFAALFSDWCEYPPLYMFLLTWLSNAWNCRILGGRGQSAIPYLHVNDAVSFMRRVLRREADLRDGEILICSPDGAVSHKQLFATATYYYFETPRKPLLVPRPLVPLGIHTRCLVGRFMPERPFERPWMAKYVDKQLTIDAGHSRQRLDWAPSHRLEVLYRLPFLIENMRYDQIEWTRRNRGAMKQARLRANLHIHSLLQKHKQAIIEDCTTILRTRFASYQSLDEAEHEWNHRLILRNLFSAIRTRMKLDFMSYCRDLALRRRAEGFTAEELVGALETIDQVCVKTLLRDPEGAEMKANLYACISMTIRFGIDQVLEVYEEPQGADTVRSGEPGR
ncbi:NAD(P)-dependent oxidoreductase [bacterium]|nr:NAD(P)-dependent oxidoreductase [bacterium]